jgi:signal transduction histidine kinase
VSIVVRLTLLNSLVLLVALGSFAGISYVAQEQALQSGLDASLREQVQRFQELPGFLTGRPPARARASAAGPRRLPLGPTLLPPDVFVQVTDRDGTVVARSRTLEEVDALPVTPEMLNRVLAGAEWLMDIDQGGQALRLLVAPIGANAPGGPRGMIQVARPLAPVQGSLRTLQTTFLSLGAVAGLASLVAAWLLARAALKPIDWLAATAHAVGTARDFSRRVPLPPGRRRDEVGRLAEELNRMLGQLQAAYQQSEATLAAQRRFVADASHELRTPLTSLRGNVELLRDLEAEVEDAGEREQILADIAAESDRLGGLVKDLLLLAQADAGQHLALVPVDLESIAQNAFRSARFLREGVALSIGEVPAGGQPGAEDAVLGNADALTRLLLILLDNALKYTPSGGQVRIDGLAVARGDVDGSAIRVADTGPGIPREQQPRVFERFYRADPARGAGGAGLGLAIAQWIVDEHRGAIEIESAPGLGTTVTVWLPRTRIEAGGSGQVSNRDFIPGSGSGSLAALSS